LRRVDMKVILKENVESLGKAGDTIKVSDGYARNFLIPKGLAVEASSKNVSALEHERKRIVQKAEKDKKKAEELAARISDVICTILRRVGEQDKMFGSVHAKDIEKALFDQGIEIDKKNIVLEESIKSLGEFPVKIKLHSGITAQIKVVVAAEA
jgi:large subunit ribosomal protein L9